MGSDKALLVWDGETLLQRALALARQTCGQVFICGPRSLYGGFGETVEDAEPGRGPLSGIQAALHATRSPLNLILSVDLPLMTADFLAWLLQQARSGEQQITAPEAQGRLQPLCAVYNRQVLGIVDDALAEGDLRVTRLFHRTTTRIIAERDLRDGGVRPFHLHQREHSGGIRRYCWRQLRRDRSLATRMTNHNHKPYILFDHVSKAFGDKVVLDDVSFDVMPGETVCILGRSGVGKSVSLHHIMGFLKPDSGRVWVAYEDITDYPEQELERIRKKVTMVFQNGALFDSLTVGENVAFPLRERGGLEEEQIYQIIDGLLDMVGVREFRDVLPSDLSTGMKRSVAIARALAAQPEAVLYDEPTTMVDPLMAHLLGDLIKKLKKQLKLTSIVVTHDMALAKKLADRLVFLHEARVIFFGTFAEMARCNEPIVQEFLELDSLDFEAYFGAQRPPHAART